VFLETTATMLFTSVAGVGLGLVFAYLAARQGSVAWRWPEPQVYAFVGAGVGTAMLLSTFALPLLNSATRHDAVRYE
jgi:hypothetical protein